MLTEQLIISKQRKLSPAEDYQLLRKTGLSYIESLGSELWTDYNAHDPGITILEALCYAITELGYRNNIDIKDLLADENGNVGTNQTFYTARNILTCSPLTINDYRKLLVDIIGIHNAWLYAADSETGASGAAKPVNEVPIFADCKKDELSYKATEHPLFLKGLYRVLLDLDNDDEFGDLNKGDIEIFNPASPGLDPKFEAGEISFTIELPHVADADMALIDAAVDEARITLLNVVLENARWKAKVETDNGKAIEFFITVNKRPAKEQLEELDMQAFFSKRYVSQVFYLYQQKIKKVQAILLQAKETLHANRNLCEDFISLKTVRDEDVAICVDIDVRPDADMEKVQAEVFYLVENYMNPSVNFYLLKELVAKGRKTEEIFEVPKLSHGFIDKDELDKTQLRSVLYASDIINLLMDVEGVVAVRNFMFTKYDANGKAVAGQVGAKWCMHITAGHKPVLSVNRSKIMFFKNNFPFLATYDEIRDTLRLLRATRERPKLKGQQDDLPLPKGTHHDLADYYSIQNDLPQTYGVGEAGLPLTATPLRKAQAKQLKVYLLFYDQLLANFFSQLSNASTLFSLHDVRQTYFAQYLQSIPGIEPIFKQDPPGTSTLSEVFASQDSTASSSNERWKKLVEDEQLFAQRRNKFLDHLLARFAESFNNYVLMMYSINHQTKSAEALSAKEIVDNKIDFLKEYPAISYSRGTAFNYYPLTPAKEVDKAMLWDTGNVSGLEKRSAKFAGITNYFRRFLSCIKNVEIKTMQENVIQEDDTSLVKTFYEVVFTSKRGDQLLLKEKFEDREGAELAVTRLLALAHDRANYLYDVPNKKLELIDDDSKVVAVTITTYANKGLADKASKQFAKEFSEDCADAEGMLLIEHLLLRPRNNKYQLMQVCLDKDCQFCGEEDPYSFRASVFLPYWPDKFNHMNFRTYFQQMIREEAPAHILLKVCWISNTAMRALETAYQSWLSALANYTHDPQSNIYSKEMKADNDALVLLLTQLHTVYPEATLHDCDESVNTNPVMLGKTILGTVKPISNE